MERNKRIIITGGANGLGAAIVAELEIDSYGTIEVFDKINGQDVRRPEAAWPNGLSGPVDVLINCAGINRIAWLEDLDFETWTETLETNTFGIMRMTQYLLPNLTAARGTVLNIVSNASHMPMRGSAAYNASKGAAHILTLQMARELYGRHGITVFGISPNRLAGTPMSNDIDEQVVASRGWTLEEAQRYQRAALPIGEETDPQTLAEFIAFLLSQKRRHKYLHGCIIPYGA